MYPRSGRTGAGRPPANQTKKETTVVTWTILAGVCGFALGSIVSGIGFYLRQEALIGALRARVEGRMAAVGLPPAAGAVEAA